MKHINNIRIVAFALILLVISQFTFGQDSNIKNRLNIKSGYARYGGTINGVTLKNSNFRIEGNYGITDYLESGAYIGVFKQAMFYSEERPVISYGLNANFHILPFFINAKDLRADLYITGRYGLRSMLNPPDDDLWGKFFPEFGIGGGFAFYPWKHLGLYTECSYGKYEYNTSLYKDRIMLRYGLSFKF